MDNEKQGAPLFNVNDGSSAAFDTLNHSTDNSTDNSTHVDNHNVHTDYSSHIVYQGSAATEKLREEKKEEYRQFCKRTIVSSNIDRPTRLMLDEKGFALGLSKSDMELTEKSVMAYLVSNELNAANRSKLELAKDAILNNDTRAIVDRTTAMADHTENEEVQFYANLILAVEKPSLCITRYQRRQYDNYWQTFWTYFAYKATRNNVQAEELLDKVANWYNQPEDQVYLLSGAGWFFDYFANNAPESSRKNGCAELMRFRNGDSKLDGLITALQYMMSNPRPLYFSGFTERDFYLRLFGAKERTAQSTLREKLQSTSESGSPFASLRDRITASPHPEPQPDPQPVAAQLQPVVQPEPQPVVVQPEPQPVVVHPEPQSVAQPVVAHPEQQPVVRPVFQPESRPVVPPVSPTTPTGTSYGDGKKKNLIILAAVIVGCLVLGGGWILKADNSKDDVSSQDAIHSTTQAAPLEVSKDEPLDVTPQTSVVEQKAEQKKEVKSGPEKTVVQATAAPAPSKPVVQSSSKVLDLGYAVYKGKVKDGLPDDVDGRMEYREAHIIDSRDRKGRVAEPGDYVMGEYSEGHLVQGTWFGSDNQIKGSILIGK